MPAIPDILRFLHGQLFQTPPVPTTSFAGQTVVITGANTGLGLDAAKHLYLLRYVKRVRLNVSHLILGCRNASKGEKAKLAILASVSTSKPPTVEVWPLDMANYASVLAFADRVASTLPQVDAFIANAGIVMKKFEMVEGHESTLTVNVISTFLLAVLMLPRLRENARRSGRPARLEIVGSAVHVVADERELCGAPRGSIFETLSDGKNVDMANRYNLSKLLVMLGVEALAAQMDVSPKSKGAPVVLDCVNPGWCRTELFRQYEAGVGEKIALRVMGRSSEVGSRTIVHGASTAAGKELHGKYLSECQVKRTSVFVRSEQGREVQKRVWDELAGMLDQIRPGVTEQI